MGGWEDVPVFGSTPPGVSPVVRPSAYALLEDGAGRIAVVETPNGLSLPGGGMENDESPARTVIREAREECGLLLGVGAWTRRAVEHIYSPSERTYFEKRSTFVEAIIAGPRVAPTETDHELLWLDRQPALERLWHESHRWAITRWIEERR